MKCFQFTFLLNKKYDLIYFSYFFWGALKMLLGVLLERAIRSVPPTLAHALSKTNADKVLFCSYAAAAFSTENTN